MVAEAPEEQGVDGASSGTKPLFSASVEHEYGF